jgi:tetratricopeptide (TPR) repeat protein
VAEHPEDRAGLCELFHRSMADALPLDVRRRECQAAVLATLRRADAVLVFEDVHRYDAPSRAILTQLITQPGQATVIATSQKAEAIDAEVAVLRLGPLDPLAGEQLRQEGLPPGVSELAGGVPLAISEWVAARREGVADITTEARLAALPSHLRALVDAAAVAGEDVPLATLARVAGLDDPQAAIDELAGRGWLRGGDAPPTELSSPTLRARIYDAIPDDRRRALHRNLVDLLVGGDPIVAAHHAYLSGEGGAVVLEQAGDHARAGFDDDAAARWFRAALDRGRQALASGHGDEARQIRVALKLGLVQRYRGDIVQAEHVLREALELARTRKDRWAEVQARRGLARLAQTWQDLEAARDHLTAAVGAALSGADVSTLCELYLDLAEILSQLNDHAGAERELWEGVLLSTGGDGPQAENGPEPLWRMLLAIADLTGRRGRFDEARALGEHALRHASRVESALGRGRAHAFLGHVHEALKQPKSAAEHRWRAADEMRRLGDRRTTAELLLQLVDPESTPKPQARAWLAEADALANQVGWREGVERSREALKKFA